MACLGNEPVNMFGALPINTIGFHRGFVVVVVIPVGKPSLFVMFLISLR